MVLFLLVILSAAFHNLTAMDVRTKKRRIEEASSEMKVTLLPTSLCGPRWQVLDFSNTDLSFDLSTESETDDGKFAHPLRVLCDLPALKTVRLTNCKIQELPNELGNLRELRTLTLSFNTFFMLNPCLVSLKLDTLNVLRTGEECDPEQSAALTIYRLIGGRLFSQRAKRLHTCLQTLPQEAADKLVDPNHAELLQALLQCKQFDTIQVAKSCIDDDRASLLAKLRPYSVLHKQIHKLEEELRRFQIVFLIETERDLQRAAHGHSEDEDSSWDWHDDEQRHNHLEQQILEAPANEALEEYSRHPEVSWSTKTKKTYSAASAYCDLVQVLDELDWHLCYIVWIGKLIYYGKLLYGNSINTGTNMALPEELQEMILKLI